MATTHEWIGLVEAVYDLSGDTDAWMDALLLAADPLLNDGQGVSAQLFRLRPVGVDIEHVAMHGGPRELDPLPRQTIEAGSPAALDIVYRSQIPAGTMSQLVWSQLPKQAAVFEGATQGRFRDAVGIVAHSGTARGLALNAPLESPRSMADWEQRRWTQVCAHVGAGLRLRERLTAEEPEAILDPEGRVLDARAGAKASDAREGLRDAVRRMERARSRRGDDPAEALRLWEGLVGGRWSLVDRFERDGKRFLVAHRNDPEVGDPRGLSRRERQVAEFAGLGRTPKETAYALGLSHSTVSSAEQRAREKLGLASRSQLTSFFAPAGLRRRLTELALEGESILLASAPIVAEEAVDRLTPAQREVALLAVQGATNAAIARQRGSAERTVANQLQAIFEKFGVHSRAELAAALSGAPGL